MFLPNLHFLWSVDSMEIIDVANPSFDSGSMLTLLSRSTPVLTDWCPATDRFILNPSPIMFKIISSQLIPLLDSQQACEAKLHIGAMRE